MRWSWTVLVLVGCRLHFEPVASVDAAAVQDDAAGTMRCNAITRLHDDFEDGVFSEHLWGESFADVGTSYSESGGNLVLSLAPNMVAYVGYKSSVAMDLREQRIVAETASQPNPNALMGFRVEQDDANNGLALVNLGGSLQARKTIAGVFTQLNQIPFDPTMRYWAFSEHAGRVSWEWSQDGSNFNTLYSEPAPIDMASVYAHLYAGTPNGNFSPGDARFAAFNAGVTAASGACPASSFVDTFDDGVVGLEWQQAANACCSDNELAGTLQFSSNGMTNGSVSRSSAEGLDLRDSAITIRVVEPPVDANSVGVFGIYFDPDNVAQFRVLPTQILARTIIGGTVTDNMHSLPVSPFYLRIRESGGTIFFESSVENQQWMQLDKLTTPFAVDDIQIQLSFSALTVLDHVRFDDLNVP